MAFPSWDDRFIIGLQEIDDDHRNLFTLFDGFKEAMQNGEGLVKISETIAALESYAANHFKREEDYLASINHPEYEPQKASHEKFIGKVEEFKVKSEPQNMVVAAQILLFISEWLVEHVSQEDMKFKPE